MSEKVYLFVQQSNMSGLLYWNKKVQSPQIVQFSEQSPSLLEIISASILIHKQAMPTQHLFQLDLSQQFLNTW